MLVDAGDDLAVLLALLAGERAEVVDRLVDVLAEHGDAGDRSAVEGEEAPKERLTDFDEHVVVKLRHVHASHLVDELLLGVVVDAVGVLDLLLGLVGQLLLGAPALLTGALRAGRGVAHNSSHPWIVGTNIYIIPKKQ